MTGQSRTEHRKDILVICGPNASGKTRLAVDLALHLNGEIISADSRQVYRTMDLGTGKDLGEYHRPERHVPYHLIDIVEPTQIYTLYTYQRDCYRCIVAIRSRQKLPVLCGGTGLYLEAVLRHYDIPNVPENRGFRQKMAEYSHDDLIDKLKNRAADLYSRTDISSKRRTIRALEIANADVESKGDGPGFSPPEINPLIIALDPDRELLHERIRQRLLIRLEQGMIQEVERLIASGIDQTRFSFFGLEYKYVASYLRRRMSYEVMIRELFKAIRKYAKRQMTYFRGLERRGLAVHWLKQPDDQAVLDIIHRESPHWLA
ncbi:tRNA (adenosine(37)-N6)-dimethylallyltransferase MiaA [bacterium]|nr:tRNA (adenosine(37)-N6)-dimethylallyltransferase MiaA [bacterium]